jgi:hypothetical protein
LANARQLREALSSELDSLVSGNVTLARFLTRAAGAVRDSYFIAYALGAISIFPFYTLTDRDIMVLEEELREERTFLRAFAREVQQGNLIMDPTTRSRLYVLALRGIFERGRVEAMPPGPYRWRLGITEHCIECSVAAIGGPYQRDQYSGLGLPELPGAPGDGSVCLGLTRCGCSVELTTGPLPGQELSDLLRADLWELIGGGSSVYTGGIQAY